MSNFAVIPSVGVITCQQAAKYRDTRLLMEYDAAIREYDAGRERRIQLAKEKFNTHIATIKREWNKANAANRRKLAANSVGLVLSVGGVAASAWMKSRTGLTEVEKQGADILINRGTTFIETAISRGLTGDINTASILLLPVLTVAAVVSSPVVGFSAAAVGIGIGAIGFGDSLANYFLDESHYQNNVDVFVSALESLSVRSVSSDIAKIMQIKNEIDGLCG
jgi:hypothetical protein